MTPGQVSAEQGSPVFAQLHTTVCLIISPPFQSHASHCFQPRAGTRSVAVDFEEVTGSFGNSPPFRFGGKTAHHVSFTVDGVRGTITIEKKGLLSFRYTCIVDGTVLKETLQHIVHDEESFETSIPKVGR